MKNNILSASLFSILVLLQSSLANAFYTFQETGDLLAPDAYAVGTELQFRTSEGSGINILGRVDGGISDEWNFRGFVGLGDTDFQVGGHAKWVPFPDYQDQPAIGATFGGHIASYAVDNRGSNTELAVRVNPFLSKSYEAELGQFTPYAALPLGIRTYDEDTEATVQLALGSRFIHPEMLGAHYFAEVGFNLDNVFAYISIGANFPLNEEYLIDLWP